MSNQDVVPGTIVIERFLIDQDGRILAHYLVEEDVLPSELSVA